MKTSNYEYDLPEKRIAQTPSQVRENSKLLVQQVVEKKVQQKVQKVSKIIDMHFYDLPNLLNENDLLVINKSRVQKARLHLTKKTGGKVEVLALQPTSNSSSSSSSNSKTVLKPVSKFWEALIKPARRVKPGSILYSNGSPILEVKERLTDSPKHYISPTGKYNDINEILNELGEIPLPPYITTPLSDSERYQTIFSKSADPKMNSVAAPTAGLHLSPELCQKLTEKNIGIVELELSVGLATFTPIKTENISEHEMHTENYKIPIETYNACMETKKSGGRVIAVGTTVVRALETAALEMQISPTDSEIIEATSQLFIQPGFEFKIVDALITNFHLPRSTLLVLLDAFIGERWKELYDYALSSDYKFLSFGDAMLVERESK